MKLVIASDLHGSAYYANKLIEAFENLKADKLLLLGDILYHGPRNDLPRDYNPKAVFNLLNKYADRIICVKGNCDSEVDQMVLEFPIISEHSTVFADGIALHMTHGHKYNPQNPLPAKKGDVVLFGHIHLLVDEIIDGVRYINPGSISIPKDDNGHGYMLFENGNFSRFVIND